MSVVSVSVSVLVVLVVSVVVSVVSVVQVLLLLEPWGRAAVIKVYHFRSRNH